MFHCVVINITLPVLLAPGKTIVDKTVSSHRVSQVEQTVWSCVLPHRVDLMRRCSVCWSAALLVPADC